MIKNLFFLLLILGFIAIVVFFDIPAVQDVLNLRKAVIEQNKILQDKQEFLIKLEKLIKNYEDNKQYAEKISYVLPSGEEIPNLIIQLEALGVEGGMAIEQIEFSSVDEQVTAGSLENYKTMTINLKTSGDYYSFKNFIAAVEKNMRLMDIEKINFIPLSSENSQLFNFEITLKTYYQ